VPPADQAKVVDAAHHAFVTGFNTIAMVSVVVAAVGSVAGYALVRSRDFVASGGPAPESGAGGAASTSDDGQQQVDDVPASVELDAGT
jgi:hypothetical protein